MKRPNMVSGIASLLIDGLTGTLLKARVSFEYAIMASAVRIILAYNCPRGNFK
jgi:DNA repair protein RadC